jgi:hypothetical protein
MHQYFHVLTNFGAGIPVEYRIPSSSYAPPEESSMYSMGVTYLPSTQKFSLTLEYYHKKMSDLVTLQDGVNYTLTNKDIDELIWVDGVGKSSGIEFSAKKIQGKTRGMISAVMAKSERRFKEVNSNNLYPYKYDRPIELKLFINHQLSKKVSVAATWVYGSGSPITIPVGQYNDIYGKTILIYSDRNSARGEPYHRLDIGLTHKSHMKWGESIWNFSIINLYNHKNVYYYSVAYDNDFNGSGNLSFYKNTLFPFMPSISYSFKFQTQ